MLVLTGTLCIVTVLWGCKKSQVPPPPDASGTYQVTVDVNTVYQEMDGFGASDAWRCQFVGKNWPIEKRQKIADLLFSQKADSVGNPLGIGLSIWRFNIGAGSTEQGANSYISDEWRRAECFLNADGSYDWTKQAGQQWFLQAAKERGTETFIGFINSPPVFFTQNGKAFSPGGWHWNIQTGYFDKYAGFLADVANHFKSAGIPFSYIAPVNEPQWDWTAGSNGWAGQEGSPAANTEIAQVSRLLSQKLAQSGNPAKVEVAEAGSLNYLYETTDADRGHQIDDFFNSSSTNFIGDQTNVANIISSHSYFTVWPVSDMAAVRSNVYNKIRSVNPLVKYWETEYCILEGANSDMDGGWGRDLTMKTALYVARIIHYDLTAGYASSWQWWTALTQGDYKDGLIYLDDGTNNGVRDYQPEYCKYDGYIRESKLLWALGNFSLFIRPGMKRILGSAPQSVPNQSYGIFSSAYKDEVSHKLVMVVINYSSSARNLSFTFKGASLTGNDLTMYVTSETKNLENTGSTSPEQVSVPANSVVTLVGNYQ